MLALSASSHIRPLNLRRQAFRDIFWFQRGAGQSLRALPLSRISLRLNSPFEHPLPHSIRLFYVLLAARQIRILHISKRLAANAFTHYVFSSLAAFIDFSRGIKGT